MEKRMDQEIMKIFIGTTQGNGKMIKEMGQGKRSLKTNRKNTLVILLKINIMGKVNSQQSNSLMKVNLKMDFLKVMVKLDLIMEKCSKVHLKKEKSILEGILILIVVSMMECLKIMYLMELASSFGLMASFIEDNGNQVFSRGLEFKCIKMEKR